MIALADFLIYDKKDAERRALIKYARSAIAINSNDFLSLIEIQEDKEFSSQISTICDVDFAMLEICNSIDLQNTSEFRENNNNTELMIITESNISPTKYLTPKIKASSLLLRPFDKQTAISTVSEFIASYYEKTRNDKDDVFVVENRDGKFTLQFSKIMYLEVCEKRVFFRLKNKEYWQYGTLENIIKEFPDTFIRCHRSFAFNTQYIYKIKLSENLIYLENNICVPLSRSYKPVIKEYLSGINTI